MARTSGLVHLSVGVSRCEELQDRLGELDRILLRHMVAGIEPGGLDRQRAPGAPDGRWIAVQQLHVIVGGPADQSWARDLFSGTAILLRLATVHVQTRAVVLQHCPHGRGIVD
jgi:hypothetical protein